MREEISNQKRDDTIRSITKAFFLLELMSEEGIVSIKELSSKSKMPKPTIVRILKTLVEAGYVRQITSRGKYCVTAKLYKLGMGFATTPKVFEIAIELADALTNELYWPVSIATMAHGQITVQYSTIPNSPYAHANSTMSKHLPLYTSAHGKQWMAHTDGKVVDDFLSVNKCDLLDRPNHDQLEIIRKAGYAKRSYGRDPSTNTIAAPIFLNNEFVASLGMTFFTKSLSVQEVDRVTDKLIATAHEITISLIQE